MDLDVGVGVSDRSGIMSRQIGNTLWAGGNLADAAKLVLKISNSDKMV